MGDWCRCGGILRATGVAAVRRDKRGARSAGHTQCACGSVRRKTRAPAEQGELAFAKKEITFFKGCPAGLLRKSRAALGSERVRAALGSDGVRARAAGVTAGEDPTSFGLGSLSGSTTTTTSALSRSWGRSRRPSVAESPRVPMNGIGRRTADGRGRRGGWRGETAQHSQPLCQRSLFRGH